MFIFENASKILNFMSVYMKEVTCALPTGRNSPSGG